MLQSHYRPTCQVRLVETEAEASQLLKTLEPQLMPARILNRCENLPMYAALLYNDLRQADTDQIRTLIAVLPANTGLGAAIIDRLSKAAAPEQALPVS